MITRRLVLAGLLALAAAPARASGPANAPPPARVASMNLASDEVLAEILPAARLAAVTALVDEKGTSNAVGRVPRSVPRFPRADVERLLALSPDLVVVSEYTDPDVLALLERSGLRVHRMRGLTTFAGYRAAILDLGRAVGAEEEAARLVARYDAILADLAARLAGARRPRVLYWASGMTAGAKTAIGALVETAGAVNVAAAAGLEGIQPIGAERAFVTDPDVVLVGTWPGSRESVTAHPLLAQMRAVREGRIVELPDELLVALSHHAAEAAWRLAHALHPERVPRPRP